MSGVLYKLSAHWKLERIVVQRFAAIWFHDYGCAELKPGFEVSGDRVRLDDVDHVFLQSPWLQRMGGGFRAELRGFAGFAVKDAVVSGEATLFYDR